MDSLETLLAEIVGKSTFLSEVIDSESVRRIDVVPSAAARDCLHRWKQTAARGDGEAFARRLLWNGLDQTGIESILTESFKGNASGLPTWARIIELVMRAASAIGSSLPQSTDAGSKTEVQGLAASCLSPDQPVAFEEVLLPAVSVAREQLQARLSLPTGFSQPSISLLSKNAYLTLERSLLERLSYLAAQVLGREFSQFRPAGLSLAGTLGIETDEEPSRVYYDAFVQQLVVDGYRDLFRQYPVLARLIAVAIQVWVETSADFIQRVAKDLPMLMEHFAVRVETVPTGITPYHNVQIDSLETDLSDPHDGGKTVISITLNVGLRVVYKPKSLCLEASYYKFLQWCNSNGAPMDFAVPRVLDRGAYGWMEYVTNTPCDDSVGLQRFYIRAGMLLCGLYIMGATDCHYENLVAHGEYPVLVDAETLLHPEARPSSGEADKERFDSVLRTGMLPHWECWQKTSVLRDASALGSTDPEGLPSPVWHRVNTDEMYLRWTSIRETNLKHRPWKDGQQACPEDYVDSFVDGFRNMALFLSAHQERLLAIDGAMSVFKSVPVRFIFRPTNIYYRVLRSALSPEYLGRGIDWGIEVERLAYAFLADEVQPIGWQLLALEIQSLERLDIPYFIANSGSTLFRIPTSGKPERIFRVSSYDQAVERLKALNTNEVDWQVEIIAGAFEAKQLVLHHSGDERQSQDKHGASEDADKDGSDLVTREEFLARAQSIAFELEQRAIAIGRDGLNWLGWSYLPDGQHLQLDLLGHSLYDGRCGVALFFAALYAITGSPQYRTVAERTISMLKELLQSPASTRTRRWARNMGIGGVGGLGSVVYLLVKFAELLNEPLILEQALKSADLLSREDIDSDEDFDIIDGSAGALIALLTLYYRTADRNALRLAEHCGRTLIKRRVVIVKGVAGWQTKSSSRPLTGFSHGASGISYALLRLYEATQDTHYLEVAQEALSYERCTFSPVQSNWPDYRTFASAPTTPSYSCSWCHGAPGIALARLGSLRIVDEPEIRQDIETGLSKSLSALEDEQLPSDHLCCGNFGLVEVLMVGSTILERPSLRRDATQHASHLCERAKRMGSFRLLGRTPRAQSFFSPTFFQGMAGIGYTLLRLSCPEVLPSIALLE
jgi:type 2 lantibiotic biosynthesis protein LanM